MKRIKRITVILFALYILAFTLLFSECNATTSNEEENNVAWQKTICMGEFIAIVDSSGRVEYKLIDPVWTNEDIDMLAQLVYNEARGVKSKMEQSAVIWCVLNRVDHPEKYGNTIKEVVTAKNQFAYKQNTPIEDEFKYLAHDVLQRWWSESQGVEDVGRVLPSEYVYFGANRTGTRNVFRNAFDLNKCKYWNWSLENPYDN